MKFTSVVIAAVAAALLYGASYLHGRIDGSYAVQAKWDQAEADRLREEKQAVLDRIEANLKEKARQDAETQRLKQSYANEIAQIHAAYNSDRGLRINANICAGFAGTADADGTGGGDGEAAATRLLPEPYAGHLEELMLQAEKITAGCRLAQRFLIANGMAP